MWFDHNLLPSDYSFVVWATETPVSIEVKTHDFKSEHFPNFSMSDSVKLYDMKGNLIDRNDPDGG